nr:hypothetical protein [Acidobacteriota bacterium]
DRHMLSVFAPGRGNYAYISKEREWQQTVGFFGKALMAHDTLMRVLAAEKIASFPASPNLTAVARFEFFRRGDRLAGVWVVRQGALRFALPITTGTKPGVADYLPAPHGLPGFAAPVEQVLPAGASFYEMADGRILVAGDGADEIVPGKDGRSLRATWRRFALVGGKSGELIEPGFQVAVEWRVDGASLQRTETLTSSSGITIRRLAMTLPSTAGIQSAGAHGATLLVGADAPLQVRVSGDLPIAASTEWVGDEPRGRGARGAIPLHLTFATTDLALQPGQSRTWVLGLEVLTVRTTIHRATR